MNYFFNADVRCTTEGASYDYWDLTFDFSLEILLLSNGLRFL